MADTYSVPTIILGLGNVGRVLLRQILNTRKNLRTRVGLYLNVIGVADSRASLLKPSGLSEDTLTAALETKAHGSSLDEMPNSRSHSVLAGALKPDVILVDMTASTDTASLLRAALNAGSGLVLANKKPLSRSWNESQTLIEHVDLRYEATVGAGLPVIAALRYLGNTGDEILGIEGCMSGTLGFLCSQMERGVSYSAAVTEARSMGYTEPDPREDLSGRDVARKALILARTAGWPLEIGDLTVEALYPDALSEVSTETFLSKTNSIDEPYRQRVQEARTNAQVLRYVARVSPEGGSIGLIAVDEESLLGALGGPANYFAFHTGRYAEEPLVIAGPGAGAEVTAAGVLGDIIDLAQHRKS